MATAVTDRIGTYVDNHLHIEGNCPIPNCEVVDCKVPAEVLAERHRRANAQRPSHTSTYPHHDLYVRFYVGG